MEHPFDKTYKPEQLPKSLWAETATEAPTTHSLTEDKVADIVVIGGGILGLSTALHLAKYGKKNIVCLEAAEIGWGASGRNNGQVIPGLKYDPEKVKSILDKQRADSLIESSGNAPALVFSIIKEYGIKCEAVTRGWIQPAPSLRSEKEIKSRVRQWQDLKAPVEMIDNRSLSDRLGTNWYRAAWLDHRGGSVNPLSYTRGLASAAISEGVKLYTKSPVTQYDMTQTNEWKITTKNGSVRAHTLIIATNAYNGELTTEIRKSLISVRTAQIASEPLSEKDWSTILPKGEAASDASHLLTSFRLTPEKRLVMGGAYATGGDENDTMFSALRRAAINRFPNIESLSWQFGWSGYLAITPPHLPQIYQLGKNAYAPIGCNGRGIAMSTMTGKQLAKLITSQDIGESQVPVVKPKPHMLHTFRNLGISINVALGEMRDRIKI